MSFLPFSTPQHLPHPSLKRNAASFHTGCVPFEDAFHSLSTLFFLHFAQPGLTRRTGLGVFFFDLPAPLCLCVCTLLRFPAASQQRKKTPAETGKTHLAHTLTCIITQHCFPPHGGSCARKTRKTCFFFGMSTAQQGKFTVHTHAHTHWAHTDSGHWTGANVFRELSSAYGVCCFWGPVSFSRSR